MTFEIKDQFYMNNEPFQIISGAFHYFRTVPEYWQDRLEKLKNMGCNTVETYIPWNFHEENKGNFNFEGMRNIEHFIQLAKCLDLYMILRPSPYICAEWEFGGLPPWLLKDRNMRLRCSYEPYMNAIREYYEVLIPKLVPYQIDRGGNIILIQIENEYGYYGNDTEYLVRLKNMMRDLGITVPFATSDGPWSETIFKSGCVYGALPTGNFGSSAKWQFEQMKKYITGDFPLMCMEFWNGWFDAWGEEHHTRSFEEAAAELDELLKQGSVNFYMLEGGTNFGFMSGKNSGNKTCDVTSYDYDAPLTEDGRITEKYNAFKNIITKYSSIKEIPLTTKIKRKSYGKISCTAKTDLFSVLDKIAEPIHSVYPLTMEDIDQNYGYILYRTELRPDEIMNHICLEGASDRAHCYYNGVYIGTAFDDSIRDKIEVSHKSAGGYVDVLVENMGRENFGTDLENQRKGIIGSIKVNDHRCYGMDIYSLPLSENQLEKLDFGSGYQKDKPAFFKFEFESDELCDTFVDFSGFGKGNIFINGFNLGRFWDIGPQRTLYLPAPLLKQGNNTIIIFETEGRSSDSITLTDKPDLG